MFRYFELRVTFVLVVMLCGCEDDGGGYALPFTQTAYVKASNTSADAYFGFSMALGGDTLVVGAFRESNAATGVNGDQDGGVATRSGAAYVFRRSGDSWEQEAYLKASNADEDDEFGHSVAFSGDTIAVGAPGERSAATGIDGNQDDDSLGQVGAVYVFGRSGSTWRQEAYIKASNADGADLGALDQGDFFGSSVAMSSDTLVVGAPGEESAATGVDGDQANDSAPDSGAVYVFRRAGSSWRQEAYIKPSDTRPSALFGSSVAISGDRIAIGAQYGGENGAGTVYVFRRAGSSWVQEERFEDLGLEYDSGFGYSVALTGDTLAVGTIGVRTGSGGVYVYRRTGTAWEQEDYLEPADRPRAFALSVALSGDTLAAGGIGGDDGKGAVYVFQRAGTAWQQAERLTGPSSAPPDYFGASLGLSNGTLAIGASADASAAKGIDGDETDTSAPFSGAVFVYE